MSEATDFEAAVAAKAAKAQSVSNDGTSVTQRSLSDQIAWSKHLRDIEAANDTSGLFPLRVFQIVAPGGTG